MGAAIFWAIVSIALIVGFIYIYFLSPDAPTVKEIKENGDRQKYNNYKFTCPMCGSKKVKRISTTSRAISVATVGLASSKIGKQYECDGCKHKW